MPLKGFLAAVLWGSLMSAAPIGFVVETRNHLYSPIASDMDGNGSEETYAYLSGPTRFKVWLDPVNTTILSKPDQSRSFRGSGLTIEGMYLDPTKFHLTGHSSIDDQIGFRFSESLNADGNGTSYHNGKRVDQSMSFYWYQDYSNDMVVKTRPCPPSYCLASNSYEAEWDMRSSLVNIMNDPRGTLNFQFTTVWSDPNTFNYERHSTWNTSGVIVDVIGGPATSAVPEPASFALVGGALLALTRLRKRTARG